MQSYLANDQVQFLLYNLQQFCYFVSSNFYERNNRKMEKQTLFATEIEIGNSVIDLKSIQAQYMMLM